MNRRTLQVDGGHRPLGLDLLSEHRRGWRAPHHTPSGHSTYDWIGNRVAPVIDRVLKASLGGVVIHGGHSQYDAGQLAVQPCDMYADTPAEETQAYLPFYSGGGPRATVMSGAVPFTRSDPPATYTFNAACGNAGPLRRAPPVDATRSGAAPRPRPAARSPRPPAPW